MPGRSRGSRVDRAPAIPPQAEAQPPAQPNLPPVLSRVLSQGGLPLLDRRSIKDPDSRDVYWVNVQRRLAESDYESLTRHPAAEQAVAAADGEVLRGRDGALVVVGVALRRERTTDSLRAAKAAAVQVTGTTTSIKPQSSKRCTSETTS